MVASIHELVHIRGRLAEQRPAGARDEDLAAVADRKDARHPVEHRPEVVVVAALGGAAMDRHPDAERTGCAPGARGKRPLSSERRADRGVDAVEHGKQPVAGRLDGHAAGVFDRGCQQAIVRFERDGIASRWSSQRRVLPSIGEQERSCRRGLIDHDGLSPATARELGGIDTWRCVKSFGASVVTGGQW